MSDGEEWIPFDYCEETSPAPRSSPSAWVVENDAGHPCLADEFEDVGTALTDGQQIKFLQVVDHGGAVIVFNPDGSASLSTPMPEAAEHCCVMDGLQADTMADDTDTMLANLREAAGPNPGDEFTVSYYSIVGPLPFRFDAATRAFVQVAS